MNRHAFEDTVSAVKASLLEGAAKILGERGLPFDAAAFTEQESGYMDAFAREILYFGSDSFPSAQESTASAALALVA